MIDIVVSNGEGYIWNAEDWHKLRTEHKIMGSFDGALTESETTQVRLPFKLMPVEVQYLVKNGIARTVELEPGKRLKTLQRPVAVEAYQALRNDRVAKQLEEHRIRKRASLEVYLDKIIEGKRNKGRIVPDRETLIQEEMAKVRKAPLEFVQIDYKDPWVGISDYVPYDYPEPSSHLEMLMLRVFEEFCLHRNYFLTSGVKFGGHFLAYPGDPSKFHAQFIIQCEDVGREMGNPLLRAHERLAIGVRKTLLIASWDPFNNKVVYRAGRMYY